MFIEKMNKLMPVKRSAFSNKRNDTQWNSSPIDHYVDFFCFRWVGLVGKNYEIECAIVELEKEVAQLRKQRQTNGTSSMEH